MRGFTEEVIAEGKFGCDFRAHFEGFLQRAFSCNSFIISERIGRNKNIVK